MTDDITEQELLAEIQAALDELPGDDRNEPGTFTAREFQRLFNLTPYAARNQLHALVESGAVRAGMRIYRQNIHGTWHREPGYRLIKGGNHANGTEDN